MASQTGIPRPRVFVADAQDYADTLRRGLAWLGLEQSLKSRAGIFLKPNLTFPEFRAGVTTTREVLEAALQVFSEIHPRVCVGESDGGYGSFDADQAFAAYDLVNLGQRYGVEVVNLSRSATTTCTLPTRRGTVSFPLPRFLVEEDFLTVTLPVPKVHCLTGISLSFKNQWGCIPDLMRLRLHCYFNEIIGPLNRLVNAGLAIVDGTYGLTRNGPIIEGETVKPGWLVMSPGLEAADRVTAHLMGLQLEDYPHYRHIAGKTPIPRLAEIETNRDLAQLQARTPRFYLRRNLWNYLAKTTWYSPRWCYLVYESKLGHLLHRLMYHIRKKPEELRTYQDYQKEAAAKLKICP